MKRRCASIGWGFLASGIYLALGCLYQRSYQDLTLGQIFSRNVHLSVIGHIMFWPYLILWHLFRDMIIIGLVIVVGILIAFVSVAVKDYCSDTFTKNSRSE